MHLRESIGVALDTLRSHKLRSFLTLLGIIVSIWTLVAVVSLVNGVNRYVGDKIAGLGSNTFTLTQYSLDQMTDQKLFIQAKRRNKPIQMDEYQYLVDHAALPVAVGAEMSNSNGVLRARNRALEDVNVLGETANAIQFGNYDVAQGRFLSPGDEKRESDVVFIGPDVADKLFAGLYPVGQSLNVDGHEYQVVGVATVQGNVFGQSQDNYVMMPLGVYRERYGTKNSLDVQVKARSALMESPTADEIRMLTRGYRHLKYSEADTFGIIGADALMQLWHQITGTLATVMIGVSSIFLVVGGIVIMNIMLAAVTERTREVGIRKALGARRRDILSQFLVESAALSTTGGIIGVSVAWLFTLLANAVTPLPFSLPWGAVFLALLISTAVGLFFGVYPASKAAKLDPITALRSEV